MSAFERDYLARERELKEYRAMVETAGGALVFAPITPGLAYVQGKMQPQAIVHLGGEFYCKVDTDAEAIAILQRILRRKHLEWAEYLEQQPSDVEEAKRYEEKFSKPKSPTIATEEKEMLFFEPFVKE